MIRGHAVDNHTALMTLFVAVGNSGRILRRQCVRSDWKNKACANDSRCQQMGAAGSIPPASAHARGREGRWLPCDGVRKFHNEGRVGGP